jgi:saxitoxin biosynthesis operon SxtJ-like protein
MSAFESHQQDDQAGDGGSDRNFGLLLCAALMLIGLWPLWHHQAIRWWAVGPGLAFGIVALAAPAVLAPPKRVWMTFGWLLGKLVSPVVMAALLYLVVTPVGLVQRLFGRDPLHLKWDREAETYWQFRQPPGPKPDSMTNQF